MLGVCEVELLSTPCLTEEGRSRMECSRVIGLNLIGPHAPVTLGARCPGNQWEHLGYIAGSGSLCLHCNHQSHLENI